VRDWLNVEKLLRSELAICGAEPDVIDYVVGQVKICYEKHGLSVGWSINVTPESASSIKQAIDEVEGHFQSVISGLLSEIMVREIYFYYANGGAEGMRGKAHGSPRSIADVLKFPPKPTPAK
jgi:hypothetical protein